MNCRICQTSLNQNTDLCDLCEEFIRDDKDFQNAWHLLAVIGAFLMAVLMMALGGLQ